MPVGATIEFQWSKDLPAAPLSDDELESFVALAATRDTGAFQVGPFLIVCRAPRTEFSRLLRKARLCSIEDTGRRSTKAFTSTKISSGRWTSVSLEEVEKRSAVLSWRRPVVSGPTARRTRFSTVRRLCSCPVTGRSPYCSLRNSKNNSLQTKVRRQFTFLYMSACEIGLR